MYEHSIKVPRLYKLAAKIVKDFKENGANVKELIFRSRGEYVKALHALVTETIKKGSKIDFILNKSKLLSKEERLERWLASILITELLWGKKVLLGDSKPVKTILAYEQILKAHSSDYVEQRISKPQVVKPRYVRVNTLKLSTSEAVEAFRDEGWILKKFVDKEDVEGFLEAVSTLGPDEFMVDMHVKDLLIFPPGTAFFKHEAYLSGTIFLQEKASCIPVQVLNPPPGSVVLDMCAAPGNKTTQLAALLNDKGTIYAVDMDQRRSTTLEQMVETSGATCVKIINRDVVTITDKECPDIDYILVDPSCTGSGITNRIKPDDEEEVVQPERLRKLKGFQIKILKHALRNFPKAKRVVYSTCSKYKEENEEVVKDVLQSSRFFKLVPCKDALLGKWLNFGSSDYGDIGSYCLYSKPDKDLTIGFFVAVFERLEDGEENPHLKLYMPMNGFSNKGWKKNRNGFKGDGNEWYNKKERQESNVHDTSYSFGNANQAELNHEDQGNDRNVKKKKEKQVKSNDVENELSNVITEVDLNKIRKRKNDKVEDLNKIEVNIASKENDTLQDVNLADEGIDQNRKIKKKKKKTRTEIADEGVSNFPNKANDDIDDDKSVKKSKKKKTKDSTKQITSEHVNQNINGTNSNINEEDCGKSKISKKKKKSKSKSEQNGNDTRPMDTIELIAENDAIKKKKRKREESAPEDENCKDVENNNGNKSKKKKKSKKDDKDVLEQLDFVNNKESCEKIQDFTAEPNNKKKKSKRKNTES